MTAILWVFRRAQPGKVSRGFRYAQTVSAAAMAFGHGMQDAAKTAGVVVLALTVGGYHDGDRVPAVGARPERRRDLPRHVCRWVADHAHPRPPDHPPRPAAGLRGRDDRRRRSSTSRASAFGAPISTTHTITSAIMGVGATKRLSAVRWGVAGNIVGAWVLTFPGAGLVAAASCLRHQPLRLTHRPPRSAPPRRLRCRAGRLRRGVRHSVGRDSRGRSRRLRRIGGADPLAARPPRPRSGQRRRATARRRISSAAAPRPARAPTARLDPALGAIEPRPRHGRRDAVHPASTSARYLPRPSGLRPPRRSSGHGTCPSRRPRPRRPRSRHASTPCARRSTSTGGSCHLATSRASERSSQTRGAASTSAARAASASAAATGPASRRASRTSSMPAAPATARRVGERPSAIARARRRSPATRGRRQSATRPRRRRVADAVAVADVAVRSRCDRGRGDVAPVSRWPASAATSVDAVEPRRRASSRPWHGTSPGSSVAAMRQARQLTA